MSATGRSCHLGLSAIRQLLPHSKRENGPKRTPGVATLEYSETPREA